MLRVISGSAKGHKLKTLKGDNTRPTSARVKESLFSIIAKHIEDSMVLDLFAGTGNLGIEALSRGAERAFFVDSSKECFKIIEENLSHTKFKEKAEIIVGNVSSTIKSLANKRLKFHIIFLDPPYGKNFVGQTLKEIDCEELLTNEGIIIAEHDFCDEVPEEIGKIKLFRTQRYGDTMISIYGGKDEDISIPGKL